MISTWGLLLEQSSFAAIIVSLQLWRTSHDCLRQPGVSHPLPLHAGSGMPQPQSQRLSAIASASQVQSSIFGSAAHGFHEPLSVKHASHAPSMQPGSMQLNCLQSQSVAEQPQSQWPSAHNASGQLHALGGGPATAGGGGLLFTAASKSVFPGPESLPASAVAPPVPADASR